MLCFLRGIAVLKANHLDDLHLVLSDAALLSSDEDISEADF